MSIYWLDVWAGCDMLDQAVANGMISQEEADAIGATVREGCISTEREWHADFMKPYAARINVRNYFPAPVARFLLKTGLWRPVAAMNIYSAAPDPGFSAAPDPGPCSTQVTRRSISSSSRPSTSA